MHPIEAQKMAWEAKLLAAIKAKLPAMESLLEECSGHWGYEDPVYRFYHQSFKVYYIQERTQAMVKQFQELLPDRPLHQWFLEIIQQGTAKEFKDEDNNNWAIVTRPIIEAYLHARFFLEMMCKYGKKLTEPPMSIP